MLPSDIFNAPTTLTDSLVMVGDGVKTHWKPDHKPLHIILAVIVNDPENITAYTPPMNVENFNSEMGLDGESFYTNPPIPAGQVVQVFYAW